MGMGNGRRWAGEGCIVGMLTDYLESVQVRERPGMYLGSATGTALFFFLAGFQEGLLYSGHYDPEYEAFLHWIEVRLHTRNWLGEFQAAGLTDTQAFAHFYTLWDEYHGRGVQGESAAG